MKTLWLLMSVVGTVLPYSVFVPWVIENGLDLRLLINQASRPIAAFAWLDVAVSAVVILALATKQIWRGQRRFWIVIAATCAVGVSLGLPLYLYMREQPLHGAD